MRNYDAWLEKPYQEQYEREDEECSDCVEGVVSGLDEDGEPYSERCHTCDGKGYMEPLSRAEIEEIKAEREFDCLRNEGLI